MLARDKSEANEGSKKKSESVAEKGHAMSEKSVPRFDTPPSPHLPTVNGKTHQLRLAMRSLEEEGDGEGGGGGTDLAQTMTSFGT